VIREIVAHGLRLLKGSRESPSSLLGRGGESVMWRAGGLDV
jgi:hypothetical protein